MSLPRPSDLELIPLVFDEERPRSTFELKPPLLRHDATLYGGTAIAASMIAMEAATGNEVLWVTTQFVTSAPNGATIEMDCEVLAGGRRTSQLRVTATFDGRIAFTSVGSTGAPKDGGLAGQFEQMPAVSPPESAQVMMPGPPPESGVDYDPAFRRVMEFRFAEITGNRREGDNPTALWVRYTNGQPMTPAAVAFCADMVPLAVARAAQKMGAGMSLDNSLRFGPAVPETEWALLEMQGNLATGGYGHGTVRVWSQDGRLLAIGSQTASMVYMFDDPDAMKTLLTGER